MMLWIGGCWVIFWWVFVNLNVLVGVVEGGCFVELFLFRFVLGFCRVLWLVLCVCVFLLSCVVECGLFWVDLKLVMVGVNNYYFCFMIWMWLGVCVFVWELMRLMFVFMFWRWVVVGYCFWIVWFIVCFIYFFVCFVILFFRGIGVVVRLVIVR